MSRVRVLLLCLIATLFVASGIARAAPPPTAPPPCHMMAAMSDMDPGQPTPKHSPIQHDMLAMNCCLGCLPSLAAPVRAPGQNPERIVFHLSQVPLHGRSLAPELGPPRQAYRRIPPPAWPANRPV
jgi:hypothetical protein